MRFPAVPVIHKPIILTQPLDRIFIDSDVGSGLEASSLNSVKIQSDSASGIDYGAFLVSTLPQTIRVSYLSTVRKAHRKKRLPPENLLKPPVVVLAPGTYPISNEFVTAVEASTLKASVIGIESPPASVGFGEGGFGEGGFGGAGSDGFDVAQIALRLSDTGTGSDASTVANPITVDAGSGSEIASISEIITDSGSGLDTGTQKFALSQSDTGSGAETASNTASLITGTDSGSGTENGGASASIPSVQTGIGNDSLGNRVVVLVDGPNIGLESANLSLADAKSSEDNASGVDFQVYTYAAVATDSGSASETTLLNQPFQSDSGSGSDTGLLTFRSTLVDSGGSNDASIFAAAFTGNEFSIGSESRIVDYEFIVDETGTATENEAQRAVLSDADSGAILDEIENFILMVGDGGSIYEVSDLIAEKFGDPEFGYGSENATLRAKELGSGRRPVLISAN